MEIKYILDIIYLVASVTFVLGLKMLSHPDSARKGNLYAAFGMTLAIIGTILLYNHADGYTTREPIKIILILAAIGVGTVAGWLTASKVQMTKMPELVSLFNGMGGACAAIIGLMEYEHNLGKTAALATIIAGLIIGSVSFSGSVIAFLKLNETMKKPIRIPKYNILNTVVMIALVLFGVYIVYAQPEHLFLVVLLFVFALVYGVLFVIPIGGADMQIGRAHV